MTAHNMWQSAVGWIKSAMADRTSLASIPAPILRDPYPPAGALLDTYPSPSNVLTDQDVVWKRVVTSDPRELWYLALPSKMLPQQVEMIKRAGLGGDQWQQWQLAKLMADSWPMYAKCQNEICDDITDTEFLVEPFCVEGEEPSETAMEKAATVRRAVKGYKPDPFSDEKEFHGMVRDLCDAVGNGISICEVVQWYWADDCWLPRATAWVHPRHYTFTSVGRLTLVAEPGTQLVFNANNIGIEPHPDKFLCAQFQGAAGSALSTGKMRSLALWWSMWMFAREWMWGATQTFGQFFLHLAYESGCTQSEIATMQNFLKGAGTRAWCMYKKGSELHVEPPVNMGPDNPRRVVMQLADEACQHLWLGQTATTTPTPGKLGNPEDHTEVKRNIADHVAGWLGRTALKQFAAAVCRRNWGNDDECPTIRPKDTEQESPQEGATRLVTVQGVELPVGVAEAYKATGFKQPQPGDLVFVGGRIGKLGQFADEISMEKAEPSEFGLPQPGQPGQPGQSAKPGEPKEGEDALKDAVAQATESELVGLVAALIKAKERGGLNGDVEFVHGTMEKLSSRNRLVAR